MTQQPKLEKTIKLQYYNVPPAPHRESRQSQQQQ
jgi:hypothetical protein